KVFICSILAMLFMTAITVVYPIILQITIDDIVLGRQYQLAACVSLGFIAVMVMKGMATYFHQYLGDMFGIKSVDRL
ncbi:ABC transporter ATP-binding protein, partial [Bacillus subtilis]|nr:ABC transporter ATP-binding protein [Bacillus subtilis]